jgi:hypothetical protein
MPENPVTFQKNSKLLGTEASAQHPRGIECYSSPALDLEQMRSLGDLS